MRELVVLFLKLGTIAFGGPAAHTAMMRDEVVGRKRWLSDREFLDLVAATNLIPGPNSTELAIHIGHRRAGWPGLLVAGVCFILPAALIVGACAWAYVKYGTRPDVRGLFYGIGPVVIAIVMQALWTMAKTAITSSWLAILAIGGVVAALAGVNELIILAAAAGLSLLLAAGRRSGGAALIVATLPRDVLAFSITAAGVAGSMTLGTLFGIFFKAGALLFGSGYVLLAFLRADLVEHTPWLTESQLIDAIAIGQFTPGPLFTTATFIGYVLAGAPGAVVATIAIFLPAFIYVAISAPFISRLRSSKLMGALLDGVTAASLALMAAVTVLLGRESIVDVTTASIALVAIVLLMTTKLNSAWLILSGALIGLALQ